MAIMDARLEFCDGVSLGGAVATTVRGHTIDLGVEKKDYGDGTPVYLHARIGSGAVNTTGNGAGAHGAATLEFYLQEAKYNTPASFATILILKSATAVSPLMRAGYKIFEGALPSRTYRRYLRLATATATSTLTATGTLDAYLSLDPVT